VSELIEYPIPDRTPNIEKAKVVSSTSVAIEYDVSVGAHVVVKYRIKPKHVNFFRLVPCGGIVGCQVTAVEVCCALGSISRIFGDSGIELAYLMRVFHMERCVCFHEGFWSCTANPVVWVERNRTLGKGKAHLEIDDAGGIWVTHRKWRLVADYKFSISVTLPNGFWHHLCHVPVAQNI